MPHPEMMTSNLKISWIDHSRTIQAVMSGMVKLEVSVPSLPAGGKTRGGFHKTAPYELHGSVSRLTLSDNAQHNSAAAML